MIEFSASAPRFLFVSPTVARLRQEKVLRTDRNSRFDPGLDSSWNVNHFSAYRFKKIGTMIFNTIIPYCYDKRFAYQVIVSLTTYYTFKLVNFVRARRRRYRVFAHYGIPGPKQTLLDGNLGHYRKHKAFFQNDKEYQDKYGKVYGYFIGDEPSLVVTDLEMVSKIFLEESGKSLTERSHVFIESVLSKGILFAKYPRWKAMRKIISPAFSKFRMRGGSATEFIENSIRLMIEYLDQKISEAQAVNQSVSIDVHKLMKSTTLHLISAMAIKLPDVRISENEPHVDSLDAYLNKGVNGIVVLAIKFPPIRTLVQFLAKHFEHDKTLGKIHRAVDKVVDEQLVNLTKQRLSSNAHVDEQQGQLIDTLIKLHHEGKLSRDEVMGNVETILFAGYDTTSTTLTYAFWVLAKHQHIQDRLRSELMAHGVESKYSEQVLNETMRLYPSVVSFTSRLATRTFEVGNLTIPEGCRVVYNAWLMHRDPNLWPDPERFDPERFREGVDIHPAAFAPFGLGDRKCLGYQLAMLEMKMIVCDLLLRYKLNLVAPQNLELISHAVALSEPKEKVFLKFERL